MTRRSAMLLLLAVSFSGCTAYEYEEDVFLNVDGSGDLRVSGSAPMLEALFETEATVSHLRSFFDAEGLEVEAVRETERGGRLFLHVQGRFGDWNELCRHAAFRRRRCRLTKKEEASELDVEVPGLRGQAPRGVDPEAVVALRFHLPSTVRFHNAPEPVQRGNILAWERSVSELFGEEPLSVRVSFDRESVLATTFRILALALGAVLTVVSSAILVMVWKGRRQLGAEAPSAAGSTTR